MRSDPLVAHRRCPSKERERGGGREGGTINAAHRRCPSRPSVARFYGRRQLMPPNASVDAANRCRRLLLWLLPTNALQALQRAGLHGSPMGAAFERRSGHWVLIRPPIGVALEERPALGARSGLCRSPIGEPHRRQIWLVHRRRCRRPLEPACRD